MLKMPRTRKTLGMTPAIATPPDALPGVSIPSRILIATVVALMGLLLLFGAGFANSLVLHEAAHDARHGLGFPCH